MEAMADLWLLVTDAEGHVTSQVGSAPCEVTGLAASDPDLRGLSWREALCAVTGANSLPGQLPAAPLSYRTKSAGGRPLRVLFAPVPWDAAGGSLILLQNAGPAVDVRAQRFSALGMLAAGAAHEMNNLLAVASGWLELALAEAGEGDKDVESLKKAAEAVRQLSGLSHSLLDFARGRAEQAVPVDLHGLVRQVVELVDYQLEKDNVQITTELAGEPLVVTGCQDELSQTLLNLILNARQAMPDGGTICVSTTRGDGWAVIAVRDTGCGISCEVRERVLDPFFSTRRKQGGTGLGLAVCRQVVERHGGVLDLQSELGVGTTVTIRLPMAREGGARVGN